MAAVPPPPPLLVAYWTVTAPALPPVRVTTSEATAPSVTEYVALASCSEPNASLSVIVTVAVLGDPRLIDVAGRGLESVTVKVPGPSTRVSLMVATVMVRLVTPGPKTSVPLAVV